MGWWPCCCGKDCSDCNTCTDPTVEITDWNGGTTCESYWPSISEITIDRGTRTYCKYTGGWNPSGDVLTIEVSCFAGGGGFPPSKKWRILLIGSTPGADCNTAWELYVPNTNFCPPRGTFVVPHTATVPGGPTDYPITLVIG